MKGSENAAVIAALRQGLAGALGGFLGFLVLEPRIRREELGGASGFEDALGLLLAGLLLGGLITFLLAAADELPTGRWVRALLRGVGAGGAGALLGVLFLVGAGFLYSALLPLAVLGGPVFQILRRALVWGLWGFGVGLSAGLVSRSQRRIVQGCLGGLLGGLVGGFLFDVLAEMTSGATLSRFVGFVGLGLCVGVATALVEQLARVAWVRFLTGSREGKTILLHRDVNLLGRDELADLPLFGDPAVARKQALLRVSPTPSIQEIGPTPLLRVDGQPCRASSLADGTVIEIGRHRFRFHLRASAPPGMVMSPTPNPGVHPLPAPPMLCASPMDTHNRTLQGIAPDASPEATILSEPEPLQREDGIPVLRVVAGPSAGSLARLTPGLTLGREQDNHLQLADAKVSRYHARIDRIEDSWVLTDLDSTNGTRLNGVQITRAGLEPGDYLYLGDSVVAVE